MTIMQGARPITAPGWTGQPRLQVGLVDCDIHQSIKQQEDLFPYLPRVYHEQIVEQGLRMPGSGYFNVAKNAARTDLAESCDASMFDGRQRGDDYEMLREHHLDPWNVEGDRPSRPATSNSGPAGTHGNPACRSTTRLPSGLSSERPAL